jgi:hypothetical protein
LALEGVENQAIKPDPEHKGDTAGMGTNETFQQAARISRHVPM